jgi:hypothetical protein
MARGPRDLVVRFVADVLPFLKDTRKVEDAFGDMVDAQDDLVREGKDATRDLGRAYERLTDKVKRENRDVERDTKQTYKDAGKEAGDEFAQNLGESISGGDISGLISGTVGGLVGTFGKGGPIALAIGALGAVGVGVFQQLQVSAQEAATAAQAAFDNLSTGADKLATTQTNLETAFGKGDYVSNLKEAKRLAGLLGIDQARLLDLINDGNRGQEDYKRILGVIQELTQKNIDNAGDLSASDAIRVRAAQDIRDAVERTSAATNDAIKAQADTERYLGGSADAAERLAEANRKTASYTGTIRDNLAASAASYAKLGSAYAAGGSAYNSQMGAAAPYVKGSR